MRENIHPLYASDSQKKIDVPIPEAAQEVKEDTTPSLTEAFHVATEEIVERLPKLHDKRLAELVKLGFGLPIVSCIERRLEENLKSAFRTYPETLGLLLQEKYAARMLDAIGRIPPSAWPDSLCAALEFTSYEYKPQVLSLLETHLDQIDFSRPAVASMIGAMMVDTRMVEMVLRMIAQHFQTIDLRNEKISWLLLLAVDQRQIDQVISLLPLQIQMNHVGEWGQELLGRLVGYGQADALFKRIPSGQIDITDKRIHILFLLAASHGRAEWVLEFLKKTNVPLEQVKDLLQVCASHKQAADVIEYIRSRAPTKATVFSLRSTLYICARYGQAASAAELLMSTGIDDTDIENGGDVIRIFEEAIEQGTLADKVFEVVGPILERASEMSHGLLLLVIACASHGYAAEVFHQITAGSWKEKTTDEQRTRLFSACAAGGYTSQVMDFIKTHQEQVADTAGIYRVCAENGAAADMLPLVLQGNFKPHEDEYFLLAIIEAGYGARVLEYIKKRCEAARYLPRSYAGSLQSCAVHGFAPEILDLVERYSFYDFNILVACAKHGESQRVLELFFSHCNNRFTQTGLKELHTFIWILEQNGVAAEEIAAKCYARLGERQYTPDDTKTLKKNQTDELERKKNEFLTDWNDGLKRIDSIVQTSSLWKRLFSGRKSQYSSFFDLVTSSIRRMSGEEFTFFSLHVKRFGIMHPRVTNALERYTQGQPVVFDLEKTGSDLRIAVTPTTNEPNIVFVNDISNSAAEIWKQAAAGTIPIAPIIQSDERLNSRSRHGETRVVSRYCGQNLHDIRQNCLGTRALEELRFDLQTLASTSVTRLRRATEGAAIDHGHTHEWNFTVEWIDRRYYSEKLREGFTVNTMPFNAEQWTFRVDEYIENPAAWQPIVRLIDWDQARSVVKESYD